MMTKSLHDAMPEALRRLLKILRGHAGRYNAISMIDLYEQWADRQIERKDGKPIENVATLSRSMRQFIDDLRDVYGIPVMSSSGSGYWIVENKKELEEVRHEFVSRGLKSLQTAARLASNSLVDEVAQLQLDLTNSETDIYRTMQRQTQRRKVRRDDDMMMSRESRMAIVTTYLSEMLDDPDRYGSQIRELQERFGSRLVPASVLREHSTQLGAVLESLNYAQGAVRHICNKLMDETC